VYTVCYAGLCHPFRRSVELDYVYELEDERVVAIHQSYTNVQLCA